MSFDEAAELGSTGRPVVLAGLGGSAFGCDWGARWACRPLRPSMATRPLPLPTRPTAQDLVNLILVAPMLALLGWRARRGHLRAYLARVDLHTDSGQPGGRWHPGSRSRLDGRRPDRSDSPGLRRRADLAAPAGKPEAGAHFTRDASIKAMTKVLPAM